MAHRGEAFAFTGPFTADGATLERKIFLPGMIRCAAL